MITKRVQNFLSVAQLERINHELLTVPRWIYRSVYPNNFWRYYVIDDLARYDEKDPTTWYGNQVPDLPSRLGGHWRQLFDQVLEFAGQDFVLQRYTINGQTLGQEGVWHTDVGAELPGSYCSYLCYLNLEWDRSWAGATELMGDNEQVIEEVPEPGTLIVFDSKTMHRGRAPSRPDLLRLTMLWHGKHLAS